ncbi:hypothetical protein [Rariglobus hedericola]|uniref:Uncharacterized protein n=1 Tax=Rariglobus hedericola TaxID=2597822 RepID=A0A556QLK6_9BACT|nr:hypothetical protein [Rariglobus hedericola]TSJ77518.1 hypothetical protein FPL22_15650 [Rariglobus hedericola]
MTETKLAFGVALRSTGTAIAVLFFIGILSTILKPYHAALGDSAAPLTAVLFLLLLFWLFYKTSRQSIKVFKQTHRFYRDDEA